MLTTTSGSILGEMDFWWQNNSWVTYNMITQGNLVTARITHSPIITVMPCERQVVSDLRQSFVCTGLQQRNWKMTTLLTLYAGSPPVTNGFPAQRASNVGSISMSWHHDSKPRLSLIARFMGPTWGSSGSCRPQMGPMLVYEPCYLGWFSLCTHEVFTTKYHSNHREFAIICILLRLYISCYMDGLTLPITEVEPQWRIRFDDTLMWWQD